MNIPSLNILPEQWQYFRQRDFSGGENKLILPEFMAPNQLITGQNCVMTNEGIPETRLGKTKLNLVDLSAAITSLHRYSTEAGDKYLLAQVGTKLYGAEWDGEEDIPDFSTEILTLTSSNKLRSAVWKDVIILTNGVDAPFILDSNLDDTTLTNAPDSYVVKIYGGRAWFVDASRPNVLCPSELEDYTSFDALNEIKVRDGDGDIIMNLSPQNGGMLIFKTRSIWPLYGTSRTSWQLATTPMYTEGLIGRDAIVDEGIFLGSSCFHQFTLQSVNPVFLSHKPVIAALTLTEKQATFAVTDTLNRRVLFNLGSGDTLCVQEQDAIQGNAIYYSMFTWTGLSANSFCSVNDKDDPNKIVMGCSDGAIYELSNDVDDDGTGIETEIQTAYNDFDKISKKIWRRFTPELELVNATEPYAYDVTYDVDYGILSGIEMVSDDNENILVWDQDNWDEKLWGFKERVGRDVHFCARGNRISFAIKSNTRLKFLGYTVKYQEVPIL